VSPPVLSEDFAFLRHFKTEAPQSLPTTGRLGGVTQLLHFIYEKVPEVLRAVTVRE
jgi:hypothetical protein